MSVRTSLNRGKALTPKAVSLLSVKLECKDMKLHSLTTLEVWHSSATASVKQSGGSERKDVREIAAIFPNNRAWPITVHQRLQREQGQM